MMNNETDLEELAHKIAEIATTTTDPETAQRLMDIVDQLLTEAGLPPDNGDGGGEPPPGWVSEPEREPV